jgi:hypothetical protein
MSIYHLHIPRTSGGYIRRLILNNSSYNKIVSGHHKKIAESDFIEANFISGHYGINPLAFSSKNFSVVRDPCELTFSYIKYLYGAESGQPLPEDHVKRYLYEDGLRESVTNVMSKFLTQRVNFYLYNLNLHDLLAMANSTWHLEGEPYSVEKVLKSISDNNIKLFSYQSKTLYADIAVYLNLEVKNTPTERLNKSIVDIHGLYEKYIDEISKANSIDLDLYNNHISPSLRKGSYGEL